MRSGAAPTTSYTSPLVEYFNCLIVTKPKVQSYLSIHPPDTGRRTCLKTERTNFSTHALTWGSCSNVYCPSAHGRWRR